MVQTTFIMNLLYYILICYHHRPNFNLVINSIWILPSGICDLFALVQLHQSRHSQACVAIFQTNYFVHLANFWAVKLKNEWVRFLITAKTTDATQACLICVIKTRKLFVKTRHKSYQLIQEEMWKPFMWRIAKLRGVLCECPA